MKTKMTKEMIEKAKEAQSAEEILTLAKDNGYEMTEEEANAYYEQFHKTGELSDDELDNVSGGGCHTKDGRLVVSMRYRCKLRKCGFCGGNQINSHDLCTTCGNSPNCDNCVYCSYEKGLWLCNREENRC